jgi:hypothetical protein
MTTLAQTIVECRNIPRTARVSQGFPRLNDFARHVRRLRAARTARRARNLAQSDSDTGVLSPERVTILARLTRIIEDDARLRLAARRGAVDWSYSGYRPLGRGWTPPVKVVWTAPQRPIDQQRYPGLPVTTPRVIGDLSSHRGRWKTPASYERSTRRIAVPAAWVLARLRERARGEAPTNISVIVWEIERAILARQQQMHELRGIHKRSALIRERVTILARLKRIVEDDARLRLAARRSAVDWSYPAYRPLRRGRAAPIEVVWTAPDQAVEQLRNAGLPVTTPGVIDNGHSYPWRGSLKIPRHRVAVPAAWLLARLRERARANPCNIVREADRAILARQQQLREQREKLWRGAVVRRECAVAWEHAWRIWRMHSDPAVVAAQPDPDAQDTLGWRIWQWDAERRLLRSPDQGTLWHSAELRVERWDESDVLRGRAGIHARRMPRNWLQAEWGNQDGPAMRPNYLRGVVERFGRYVLGTLGWRAEWVVIRKLYAPSTEIGLTLETAYPEVEIVYADR